MPFIIEASGLYESEVFSQQFLVDVQNINQADSLSVEAWTENYIQYLESQQQTNDIVNEIIDYSINERILSVYSAFLCLEPSRGGEICYDCIDETDLVGIDELYYPTPNDSLLRAYPNPFNNQVKIEVSLPQAVASGDITFKIYNLLGQVVHTFDIYSNIGGTKYQFTWNGKNDTGTDISNGTYFFIAKSAGKRYSLKLLFLK